MADDVLGTAYVVVRAITDQVRDDIKDGINDAAKDSEKSSEKAGEKIGDDIGESAGETASERISKEIKENVKVESDDFKEVGHDVGQGITDGISEHIDRDSTLRSSGDKMGDDISEGVERSSLRKRVTEHIKTSVDNNRVTRAMFAAGRGIGNRISEGIRDSLESDRNFSGLNVGFMPAIIAGIGALITGLIPIIADATAAVGALVTAFAGAGLAAGVFGIGAMGFVKDLIQQYKNFQDGGLKNVDKEFRDIIGTIKDLTKSWNTFKEATRGPFLRLTETVLETVIGIMQKLVPVVNKVTNLFNEQAEAFRAFSQSSEFQSFINWIGTDGVRFLENFINIIKNVVVGLAGIISAFTPFAHDFMDGFEDMTESFANWGQSLKDSKGFRAFIRYVRQTGPQVLDFLGALFDALINLGKGLAPIGGVVLEALTKALRAIADADPQAIGAIAVAVGAIAAAVSLIGPLIGPLSTFAEILGTLGLLGSGSGIAAVAAGLAIIAAALYAVTVQGPAFDDMMSAIGDALSEIGENAKEAWVWLQPIRKFFEEHVAPVFQEMVEQTAKALGDLAPILKPLAVLLGVVLVAAFISLMTLLAPAVVALRILGKVVQWLGDLFNWLKAGMPGLSKAFSAAWNAIKGAVIGGWNAIKGATIAAWNAIKGAVQKAWNAIKGAVSSALGAVKGVIQRGWNAIKSATSAAWNAIKSAVQRAWNAIKGAISSAINTIKGVVQRGLNAIKSAAQAAWNAIKSAAQSAWNAIKSLIQGAISAIKSIITSGLNAAKSAAQAAWNAIKSAAQTVWNTIKSIVQTAINGVKSAISGLRSAVQPGIDAFNAVKSAVEAVTGAIGGLIDKINSIPDLPDLNIPDIPGVDLPGPLGEGGIVDKPTVALIGERGEREYVVPQHKLASFIASQLQTGVGRRAARQLTAARLNAGVGTVTSQSATSRDIEHRRGGQRGAGGNFELHVYNPSPERTSYSLMKRLNEVAQLGLLNID